MRTIADALLTAIRACEPGMQRRAIAKALTPLESTRVAARLTTRTERLSAQGLASTTFGLGSSKPQRSSMAGTT